MYYKAREMALRNGMSYHLTAIVWRNRKPIAMRSNTEKGHPKCIRMLPSGALTSSMHAETSAVRFAQAGDDIEVLRWDKKGELLCSRPCAMCYAAMAAAGVRFVTYVDWNGKKLRHRINSENSEQSELDMVWQK